MSNVGFLFANTPPVAPLTTLAGLHPHRPLLPVTPTDGLYPHRLDQLGVPPVPPWP